MKLSFSLPVLTGVLALIVASSVHAQVIPNRFDLNAMLGGGGTTETFEAYSIANGSSVNLGNTTLNSTAIENGQGPGLIVPGLTIDLAR